MPSPSVRERGPDENREPQVPVVRGRQSRVAAIEEAQTRWGVIQARGRTRGIIALVVVVVVLVAIAVLAKSNAGIVVVGLVIVAVIVGTIVVVVGKSKTGLSITPEWKPEVERGDDDFDDDMAEGAGADEARGAEPDEAAAPDPVRRLDAQILGGDLTKLGQVVSPKLAKSYAVGTLVLEGPEIVWEPGAASRAMGIDDLKTAPDQVSVVEAAPLWGSWALVRVATAGGDEWCMRVPGSVDLSPAFAELGLTLHRS